MAICFKRGAFWPDDMRATWSALIIGTFLLLGATPSVRSSANSTPNCKNYSYGAVMNATLSGDGFSHASPKATTHGYLSECNGTVAVDFAATINEIVPNNPVNWASEVEMRVRGTFAENGGSSRIEIPATDVSAVRRDENGLSTPVKLSGPVVMVLSNGNAEISFFNWYNNPDLPEQTYLLHHSVVSNLRERAR